MENNHFENDKNAFDFFDGKGKIKLLKNLENNAANIFESLSRTNEEKSNQKNKGSGLFG